MDTLIIDKKILLKLLNIENLGLEDQENICSEFEGLLTDLIINYILSQLSDEDVVKFLSLLDSPENNSEDIITFAKERIPNLEKNLAEEIKKEIIKIKEKSL